MTLPHEISTPPEAVSYGGSVVDPVPRPWRLHAFVSTVPVGLWIFVHLWEQWAGFAGREAWLARMAGTAGTSLGTALDLLLGVLPLVLWLGLEIALRRHGEPPELRLAYGEDEGVALRMFRLATGAGWVLLAFAAYHVVWLWVPRVGGLELAALWARLEMHFGRWLHAIPHAVGLGALAVHVTFGPVRLLVAQGWLVDAEGRRAARLSGGIVAVLLFVLYGQLAGWHATGVGTFWSLSP